MPNFSYSANMQYNQNSPIILNVSLESFMGKKNLNRKIQAIERHRAKRAMRREAINGKVPISSAIA